jgi:hypothetical protein
MLLSKTPISEGSGTPVKQITLPEALFTYEKLNARMTYLRHYAKEVYSMYRLSFADL